MSFCKQLLTFILKDHPLLRVCLALGPLRAVENEHEKCTSAIRGCWYPSSDQLISFLSPWWDVLQWSLVPDVGIGVNVSDKCSRRSQPANKLQFEDVEHEL